MANDKQEKWAEEMDDFLFGDAVKLVREFEKASTALLQRRLRIGYGRAVHLLDLMEQAGIITKHDENGKRQLLEKA